MAPIMFVVIFSLYILQALAGKSVVLVFAPITDVRAAPLHRRTFTCSAISRVIGGDILTVRDVLAEIPYGRRRQWPVAWSLSMVSYAV
ncbi:hypothetical protein B0H16DRAFT_1730041 [Mycena metata]|uniref:Uncharacterized protein n=1 Tax=Mycena metata TaxID=1033252 RepID=A0AAD7IBG5_9AGAR|nr:hypothetical protein B0H16DRAFT_1730041 [Mycena metata]